MLDFFPSPSDKAMGSLDVSTEGMAALFFVHVGDEPYLPLHSGFADLVPNGPLFLQGSGHSMPVQLITWQHRACLFAGWPEFMLSNGIGKGDILFCQLNREMKMSVRVCSQAADTKLFVNRISGRMKRMLHKERNDCGQVERPCKRRFSPVENAEESLYDDEEDEMPHKKKRKGPQPEPEVDGAEENTTHTSHHTQKHLTKNISATNLQQNQEHVGNVDAENNAEEQIKSCTNKHTTAADAIFHDKEQTHMQHEEDDEQGNENGNSAAHKSFINKPFRCGFRLKRIRRSRHEEDHDGEHVQEEEEEEEEDEEHEEEDAEEEEGDNNDAEEVGNTSQHQKHVRRNNLSSITWRMKQRRMKQVIQEHNGVNEAIDGKSHYNKKKKGYNRFVVSSGDEEEEEDNVASLPWHIKRKTKSTPTKHMPSPEEEEGAFQIEITRHRLSTGCNIPAAYARYFPSGEATSIYIIGPEGIIWRMGVGYTKCRYPVLSPGWRGFQKHYKLSLDDVVCFRMINRITFKVHILRASQLLKN